MKTRAGVLVDAFLLVAKELRWLCLAQDYPDFVHSRSE